MFAARRSLDLPPERRSRLKLNEAGICQTCRADEGSEVPQFSSENNLDHGGVPTHLEQLPYTDIEEILIAHVRTAVNVFQDTPCLYAKLPLLPRDAEVLLLRPRDLRTGELSFSREYLPYGGLLSKRGLAFYAKTTP
ncbi:hypothetical protein E4U28_000398, partial [Claviceps purpurea]